MKAILKDKWLLVSIIITIIGLALLFWINYKMNGFNMDNLKRYFDYYN